MSRKNFIELFERRLDVVDSNCLKLSHLLRKMIRLGWIRPVQRFDRSPNCGLALVE
jgi:hypothetical protein